MYTPEQRKAIGRELLAKFSGGHPIPWTKLSHDIKKATGFRIPLETMRRVFNGGHLDGEDVPAKAHKQDVAISLLTHFLRINVNTSTYRPSFDASPEMYFPASYAFKPYNKTWIADCFDIGSLKHLQNACAAAGANNVPTDGHDKQRLVVVTRHKTMLERMKRDAIHRVGHIHPALPLPMPAVSTTTQEPPPATRHIEVAPDRTGFSLDVSKSLVKQLEQQGLPTAEIKAAIVQKITSDKATIERLISSVLGF